MEANDAGAMCVLGNSYYHGQSGLQQDRAKGDELLTSAAALGSSMAHFAFGNMYREGGELKKAKIHGEAAAMAGHEVARCILGNVEAQSGNMGRAVKHWMIAASGGKYNAMQCLLIAFSQGWTSRATIDATLIAYNENGFARAFGGAGGTRECRGGCPPDPPSVGDVTGHSPFLCFLQESFLAN